ncbi:MAG TPA: hypothetical protein VH482_31130 [Thermomicrobiales bacterium]|jgi:hypothetical protein
MPTYDAALTLPLAQADCMAVCLRAVDGLGWLLQEQSMCHLRCREANWIGFHWPVRVVVITEPEGDTTTHLRLHGDVFGLGPIAARAVRQQTEKLRGEIEQVALQWSPVGSPKNHERRATPAGRIRIGRRAVRREAPGPAGTRPPVPPGS